MMLPIGGRLDWSAVAVAGRAGSPANPKECFLFYWKHLPPPIISMHASGPSLSTTSCWGQALVFKLSAAMKYSKCVQCYIVIHHGAHCVNVLVPQGWRIQHLATVAAPHDERRQAESQESYCSASTARDFGDGHRRGVGRGCGGIGRWQRWNAARWEGRWWRRS
jgi:hypothetical protein